MTTKSQRPKGRDGVLSSLNIGIDALDLAKEATGITQAKTAFGSASDLLIMIRDSLINKVDYVELGLTCAGVCEALNRGMGRRRADQLSQSVLGAIEKLTITVAEIQRHIAERGRRSAIARFYYARDDKEAITVRRLDLDRILHIFNTELKINAHLATSDIRQDAANKHTTTFDVHRDPSNAETIVPDVRHGVTNGHPIVSDIPRNELKSREDAGGQNRAAHAIAPGESPPPPLRNTQGTTSDACRDIVSAIHRDLVDTQTMVFNIHRNMVKNLEGADGQHRLPQNSIPGELPPPPPRVFFGRDELIEKIVGFAERLTPIAVIGVGGIGKTSTVLAVLHNDRIKQRFGEDRRFIHCDQFPASPTHFLRRLSKVIGAGIENPEDLAVLRPFLSSKDIFVVLDNAESILDLQGTSAQEIYAIVDELSRFSKICLCITSRISTIPPHCETLDIPTLSVEAARDTFYRIYKHNERSDPVNGILEQLDFHPLSITLLATVAQHNKWGANRLTREWERRRTGVLHVQHSGSLATAIELSLASPMFRELGPDARGLLGVVAFFPQGVNEGNIDWLFPTISDGPNIFDKFCILSLTYRTNGFITMLAPLRDYLRPKDPLSSPLLGTTKECYFTRLSVPIHPEWPGFKESQWVTSEDVNVEHLLDVFTSIDSSSKDVWNSCATFMGHLYWHKPRVVILGPKIESLPDDHPSKERCLRGLSWLFKAVGNQVERKRILTRALKSWRERGNEYQIALTLSYLSDANRLMDLCKEGMQQAKEALGIFEQLGNTVKQAECLTDLARLLHGDKQLNAAEEAASHAIDLLEESHQSQVSKARRVLGRIYRSKGETEKAIHHLEVALRIASSLNWYGDLFWIHFALAEVCLEEGRFNDGHAHIKQAESHAVNDAYLLARATWLRARFLNDQHRFEGAKSEALRAIDMLDKLGVVNGAEGARRLLGQINRDAGGNGTHDELDDDEPK